MATKRVRGKETPDRNLAIQKRGWNGAGVMLKKGSLMMDSSCGVVEEGGMDGDQTSKGKRDSRSESGDSEKRLERSRSNAKKGFLDDGLIVRCSRRRGHGWRPNE